MTKTKYAIVTIATILPLIALVSFLQLQTVNAQTDNSGIGPAFGDRHPTLCAVGPSGLGLLGHPFLGYALHWWCNNAN